jgi:uroporphyrinogen decarboxylase
MEAEALKREYGQHLGLFGGGIDNSVLSAGSTQQVRREARRQIRRLAPGGGYIFATIHNISQEVPAENILAFFEAGIEYGAYPILNTGEKS